MTDQVSEIEMDDKEKKNGHLVSIRAAAGLTEEDIEDRVEVFERVQWAFHSELVHIFISLYASDQVRQCHGFPQPVWVTGTGIHGYGYGFGSYYPFGNPYPLQQVSHTIITLD
jgi:hypothetical protein